MIGGWTLDIRSENSCSTLTRRPTSGAAGWPARQRCRATCAKPSPRLPPAGLETPYRDGGWTGRQVVHHVADSHLNAYTRIKLALTEDKPTIKPYEEQLWAELAGRQDRRPRHLARRSSTASISV